MKEKKKTRLNYKFLVMSFYSYYLLQQVVCFTVVLMANLTPGRWTDIGNVLFGPQWIYVSSCTNN